MRPSAESPGQGWGPAPPLEGQVREGCWPRGVKGRSRWQKKVNRACLALHCSPLWSLPEIDSWSQRAEVSPLYKMKSVSQAGAETGRFIKALAKLTFGRGTRQEQPPEGVSLHFFRLVPASSWAKGGCQGQPCSWSPRGGTPHGPTGTCGAEGDWKENHQPGLAARLLGDPALSPGPASHLLQPGPQFPRLREESIALGASSADSL